MSGRTAVIALVLSALALSYAYPMRTYLEHRSEINELRGQQADQRERIEELKTARAKWDDPNYVKSQARDRLLLVEPGEELVIIIDDPGDDKDASDRDGGSKEPWFQDLRDSFTEADGAGS